MFGWGPFLRLALVLAVLAGGLLSPVPAQAAKRCPKNTSADVYVNPKARPKPGMKPTGVASPASCSFRSITAALAKLPGRGVATDRIILTGAGDGVADFKKERFPIVVPAGVAVTTTDDPALGGAGLDGRRYVVGFRGTAATALRCDGPGTVQLRGLSLDGTAADAQQTDGIHVGDGCELEAFSVRVRNFPRDGVVAEHGSWLMIGSPLDGVPSAVHDNGRDGIVIRGEGEISDAQIALNGDEGVFVEASVPGVSFTGNIVRDNGGSGFHVQPSNVEFISNEVFGNARITTIGRGPGWTTTQPQVLFDGPGTFVFDGNTASADCNPGANLVHSYDTATDIIGSSELSVGLYARNGAVVDAQDTLWRTTEESQNVDQDANSTADADPLCPGAFLENAPFPAEPVS